MSILPEYVEVTSYKKRCNLITLHDSASQKRSLKFFMRTIRFSLLNFIWKYTTPFHAEEIFGIAIVRIHRTQGKPGKSGKLKNQEKPGKFKHSGENSWKMFELSFNLLQHGVVHNLVILFDIL